MNILSILIIGAFLIFIFKEDSSVNKAAERETRICQHCRQLTVQAKFISSQVYILT